MQQMDHQGAWTLYATSPRQVISWTPPYSSGASHCGTHCPQILIMDNHSSHMSPDVIDVAKENNIILFTLISRTIPILQVLDSIFTIDSVFNTLKANFRKHVMMASHIKADIFISKQQFKPILQLADDEMFTPPPIKNAYGNKRRKEE